MGQTRAKEALSFGLTMPDMDFHVYVAGPQRTGKTHLVTTFLNKLAADQPPPRDWVYVHNFADPDEPKALSLAPGGGKRLAAQMKELVASLKITIPEIFEGEDYARRKEGMTSGFKRKRSDIFAQLDGEAREEGYVLKFEPTGIMASPMGEDGEPLPESAIREMSDEEREKLRAKSDVIQSKVTEALRAVAGLEKELQEALSRLDQEMVLNAVGYLLKELRDDYQDNQAVLDYLEALQHDLVTNYERFKKKEQPALPFPVPSEEPSFREYEVNVFVDNSETRGAPVVVEHNPTHPNLFGRIERQAQFGALLTDFTLLKPGALHRANGGYLVLPALDLLRYWLPWEGLKRALREREVKMEDVMEQLGYMITRTLRPQPIPLDLKVVLVGDSMLYHLLYVHDQVFPKLFKVRAQMSEHMDWDKQEVANFISHLCQIARTKELLPLHRSAVARLIERAAEMAGDRERAHPAPGRPGGPAQGEQLPRHAGGLGQAARPGRGDGHRRPAPPGLHDAGAPARGGDPGLHQGGQRRPSRGPGQRPGGLRPGRLRLWQAQPHLGQRGPGQGRGDQHRPRGRFVRSFPQQGGADHRRVPAGALCPLRALGPHRQPGVRAELRHDRRRLGLPGRGAGHDVPAGRGVPAPRPGHHRLHGPARRGPGHRRGEPQGGGLLQAVRGAGASPASRGW